MNVLDNILDVKKKAQDNSQDYFLTMLDEIVLYEKLSKAKSMQDLKNSAILKKKCPLLVKSTEKATYEHIVFQHAHRLLAGLEDPLAHTLYEFIHATNAREERQNEILAKQITKVEFQHLLTYEKQEPLRVFTYKPEDTHETGIAIVTKTDDIYTVFQGFYVEDGKDEVTIKPLTFDPYVIKNDDLRLRVKSYSNLGANSYNFATLCHNDVVYSLSLPLQNQLKLSINKHESILYTLTEQEQNKLTLSCNIETFAKTLFDICKERLCESLPQNEEERITTHEKVE